MRSEPALAPVAPPPGFVLIRVNRQAPETHRTLVERAMVAAGEPDGLTGPRLLHGDECFGWVRDGQIASFAWVTYADRTVGPVRLPEKPGRAFLFNAHTRAECRGQGLHPALLLAIRHTLGQERITQFVGDVNRRNAASARGVAKAGFTPAAEVTYLTTERRTHLLQWRELDAAGWSPLMLRYRRVARNP